MAAFRVGVRRLVFIHYRMLLFEDRVEEVGGTMLGLEVRRLFFDEVESATVHRSSAAPSVIAAWAAALVLAGAAAGAGFGGLRLLSFLFSLLAVAAIVVAVAAALRPPYTLVLRARGHTLQTVLPRDPGRRDEAMGRLARSIERYQSRHAPPPPEAPDLPLPEPPA
jgi:hypothetical protein